MKESEKESEVQFKEYLKFCVKKQENSLNLPTITEFENETSRRIEEPLFLK